MTAISAARTIVIKFVSPSLGLLKCRLADSSFGFLPQNCRRGDVQASGASSNVSVAQQEEKARSKRQNYSFISQVAVYRRGQSRISQQSCGRSCACISLCHKVWHQSFRPAANNTKPRGLRLTTTLELAQWCYQQ